jgi:hypothetical protein
MKLEQRPPAPGGATARIPSAGAAKLTCPPAGARSWAGASTFVHRG